MRAYDLTVTGSLIVSGSTTLTGDITYDDLTATGDIVTTGANKVISGSSTSTGSFGRVYAAGNSTFAGDINLAKDDGFIYLNNAGTENNGVYIRGLSSDNMRFQVPSGKYYHWEVGGVQKLK